MVINVNDFQMEAVYVPEPNTILEHLLTQIKTAERVQHEPRTRS